MKECSRRQRLVHLGKPEARISDCLICLGVALGQATVPVLFFLRLILESVALLFGLSMEDK